MAAKIAAIGIQNRRRGVLKNFQAAQGRYDKINYIFSMGIYVDINL